MKLCYTLCMIWCFFHTGQSSSHGDNLRELENAVIEERALGAPEMEDANIEMLRDIEMLSDFVDAIREEEYLEEHEMDAYPWAMSQNEFKVQEENVPNPSGRRVQYGDFHWDVDNTDWYERRLAIGDHEYCGPYTQHYSDLQCDEVGIIKGNRWPYGISVKQCEDECWYVAACNAINWSSKIGLGCVLRDCKTGNGTPPMPIGDNPDWLSFSHYKPTITPHCKNLHGSYVTINSYCGPYDTYFSDSQCTEVGIHKGRTVLECDTICNAQENCTAFNWSMKKELGCVMRSCLVGITPMPTGVNPDWVSYSKNKPFGAPRCEMDVRNVDP